MIVVIADDLSGAAELAGAARGAGLEAEVQTEFDPTSSASVVAIDTNTRALDESAAVTKVVAVTRQVMAAQPEWIYKKTDSVLRGHVFAECRAIANAAGRSRVLLIPANPGRQRVIREGRYLVEGTPLDRTAFAHDPQHPAKTDEVVSLLSAEPSDIFPLRTGASLQPNGINIPDAWEPLHLRDRARQVDHTTLAAGAMDFFCALLRRAPLKPQAQPILTPRSDLQVFACGSHAAWAGSRVRDCQLHEIPIVPMPRRLFADDHTDAELEQWATEAIDALAINGRVMLAIGGEKIADMPAGRLDARLADAIQRLLKRVTIGHLLLEGGATASSVLTRCGWQRLRVGAELAPGLSHLEVIDHPAPLLLIKPGSYPWPTPVWKL